MKPNLDYNSGTTLNLLHCSKRSYQHNMLKSLALASILPLILAICLLLCPGKTSMVTIDLRNISLVTVSKITTDRMVISNFESPGSSNVSKDNLSGGLKGYTIVKDCVSPNLIAPVISIAPDEIGLETFDLNIALDDSGDVYGIHGNDETQGSSNDFGLPEEPRLYELGIWNASFHDEYFNLNNKIVVDEWATVKIDKYHKRPRSPKKGSYYGGGVAKIGVTIDNKGNIVRMDVIYERPTEHDFAKALMEWVSDWCYIFPPRINGEKVGTYITFEHFFGSIEKKSLVVNGPLIVYDHDK